jgi:hypothetical protein
MKSCHKNDDRCVVNVKICEKAMIVASEKNVLLDRLTK